ncbi:unnamed protein product [Brassica rapa subsp. trilocularis]
MAIEEGCVRFSCGCGLESCLVLGVQSRLVGVISGGSLIFDGQSLSLCGVGAGFTDGSALGYYLETQLIRCALISLSNHRLYPVNFTIVAVLYRHRQTYPLHGRASPFTSVYVRFETVTRFTQRTPPSPDLQSSSSTDVVRLGIKPCCQGRA